MMAKMRKKVKIIKDLSWRGRGRRHNSKNLCEGTALIGTIDINGNVRWQKEIWHTGGY